jgi:DNA-directed RNA polymerase specialized sigma24 family protein
MSGTLLWPALRQVQHLLCDGTAVGLTDAQLWERVATRRDEVALEAPVERHGPMVLAVGRGVLSDPHDAQDIFQAICAGRIRHTSDRRTRRA